MNTCCVYICRRKKSLSREIFNSSACRNKIILSLIILICQFKIICNENKNYFSWDFTDQNIKDIIYAISVDTGISIVTDDTVSGTGTIRFSGTDFSTAFDSFLNSTRLYVTKTDNLWTVSKFKYIQKDNLYYVDAYDLYPYEIIDKITDNVKWIITYDSLPSNKMSVHFKGVTKDVLMESLCKRFGNYEITESESGYNLKQITEKQDFNFSNDSVYIEKKDDESYEVDIKNSNFFDVLEILFTESEKAGNYKSYSILSNVDTKVERSVFVGSDFDDTLEKLCSQNNYTYVKDDNIYYFLNDKESKDSLINGKKEWRYFSLKYTNTDEVLPLIFKKLGNLETIPLLDDNSFICNCNSNIKTEIEKFIEAVDIKKSVYLVNLKYIKPQELMEYLPPTINKNNLFIADNNSSLYFKGTEEAYKTFIEQIVVIDKPATRLSYDLLILQFDENTQNILSSNFSARRIHSGNKNNLSAVLGSVMGFNLNVLTTFGINFAAELQASIEENKTRVYADTTLHGLSGKKISFQNTNTYR